MLKSSDIKCDIHTHTLASAHAYCTLLEMAAEASRLNMEAIAVTDHAPALGDAPHMWHFVNLKAVPRYINGVRILRGVEANIINPKGDTDMPEDVLKKLDIVVASIHSPCMDAGGCTDFTGAYMAAVENPLIDVLGHSGLAAYPYDYEKVVLAAKEHHKIIEINEHSFEARKSSIPNCRTLAALCKKYGVGISVDSDAHITFELGHYENALGMLAELDFPEELIVNRSYDALRAYLAPRKSLFK